MRGHAEGAGRRISGGFHGGRRAGKTQVLRTDLDNDKAAVHMTVGTLNMYVIRRAERFALRVKDSKSEALRELFKN